MEQVGGSRAHIDEEGGASSMETVVDVAHVLFNIQLANDSDHPLFEMVLVGGEFISISDLDTLPDGGGKGAVKVSELHYIAQSSFEIVGNVSGYPMASGWRHQEVRVMSVAGKARQRGGRKTKNQKRRTRRTRTAAMYDARCAVSVEKPWTRVSFPSA